jgi:hypothetical protein
MTTDRDERLATLIDRLAADVRAGRGADVDAMARDHPDLAPELRELWAVAQFAHLARALDPHKQSTTTLPPKGPPPVAGEVTALAGTLPRDFGDFQLL